MDITLKFVGRYFIWVVTIFPPKNRAILVQNLGGEKKCQNLFPAFSGLKMASLMSDCAYDCRTGSQRDRTDRTGWGSKATRQNYNECIT